VEKGDHSPLETRRRAVKPWDDPICDRPSAHQEPLLLRSVDEQPIAFPQYETEMRDKKAVN